MKPKRMLSQLVLGKTHTRDRTPTYALQKRFHNIIAIWNNDHHDDVGIEKLVRLLLALSQFLFPGIYVKHFFGRMGSAVQYLGMDLYVLLKVGFPLYLLYNRIYDAEFLLIIVFWLMLETVLYVPTLIFASDIISRPSSYRRSMMLLFFNYFEIIFAFAFIYANGDYLNLPFKQWYDPIYFSFTTLATIGFGDYFPVTGMGKLLVCSQAIIFLAFVVLFINFFSNRMENKGYFESQKKEQ